MIQLVSGCGCYKCCSTHFFVLRDPLLLQVLCHTLYVPIICLYCPLALVPPGLPPARMVSPQPSSRALCLAYPLNVHAQLAFTLFSILPLLSILSPTNLIYSYCLTTTTRWTSTNSGSLSLTSFLKFT